MSLNLCSEGHEEVCYEGHRCPVCDMEEDKNSEIADLQNQLKERALNHLTHHE